MKHLLQIIEQARKVGDLKRGQGVSQWHNTTTERLRVGKREGK